MKSDNQYGPNLSVYTIQKDGANALGPLAEFDRSLRAIDSLKDVSVGGCWGSDGSVLNRLKRPLSGNEMNVPLS
jgi:hypothetical protein